MPERPEIYSFLFILGHTYPYEEIPFNTHKPFTGFGGITGIDTKRYRDTPELLALLTRLSLIAIVIGNYGCKPYEYRCLDVGNNESLDVFGRHDIEKSLCETIETTKHCIKNLNWHVDYYKEFWVRHQSKNGGCYDYERDSLNFSSNYHASLAAIYSLELFIEHLNILVRIVQYKELLEQKTNEGIREYNSENNVKLQRAKEEYDSINQELSRCSSELSALYINISTTEKEIKHLKERESALDKSLKELKSSLADRDKSEKERQIRFERIKSLFPKD
ncbi:MAG: hypothetical protein HQL69_18475 [Magnetococcales bacterium]|nr:hypothetical protein [Magnetococcales bacterium]